MTKRIFWCVLVIVFAVAFICKRQARYYWMLRALVGMKSNMDCSRYLTRRIIKRALSRGSFCHARDEVVIEPSQYGGIGFENKPEIFYLIGGFSFRAEMRGTVLHVWGEDVYDWHPKETGGWHDSPTKYGRRTFLLLNYLFGKEEWFSMGGDIMYISNKLWHDMCRSKFTTTYSRSLNNMEELYMNYESRRLTGKQYGIKNVLGPENRRQFASSGKFSRRAD